MNEPQQDHLQPESHEREQSFYRANGSEPPSSFSGTDLSIDHGQVPSSASQSTPTSEDEIMHWEASEYIHHAKTPLWFVGYVTVMLALLAIAYFVTQSITFMVLVVVMAVAIGIFATRPPRTLHYALTSRSIQIEQTIYRYSDFRAFGVISDGALYSIMLIPTKRFMPAVNMYFAEADGEKIVDTLGARLPMQELHLDLIDQLMRRLRF